MTVPTVVPSKPNSIEKDARIYQLWYAYSNLAPQIKCFPFKGDMKSAIARARLHCEKMNYRFLRLRPLIVDLDEQEQRRAQNEFDEENG